MQQALRCVTSWQRPGECTQACRCVRNLAYASGMVEMAFLSLIRPKPRMACAGTLVRVAYAEGNALGKGPVLFQLTQESIVKLRREAAAGNEDLRKLELSMFRCEGGRGACSGVGVWWWEGGGRTCASWSSACSGVK